MNLPISLWFKPEAHLSRIDGTVSATPDCLDNQQPAPSTGCVIYWIFSTIVDDDDDWSLKDKPADLSIGCEQYPVVLHKFKVWADLRGSQLLTVPWMPFAL